MSPPRLDEVVPPGRRFALGISLLGAHFLFGGTELWGFLPAPLPHAVAPLLTLVPALFFVRAHGASIVESYAYHWPGGSQALWAILTGLSLVLPSRILGALNTQLLEPAPWFVEAMEQLQPEGATAWITHLLLIAVLVPISEETIFRGLLQPAADPVFGPARSAVLVGLLFAAFHFQPWFLIPLAVIGMVLGATRWITGSVVPCILVHGAYNLGSLSVGEWVSRSSADGETIPNLVAGLLLLGAGVSTWLCWVALSRLRPVRPELSPGEAPGRID